MVSRRPVSLVGGIYGCDYVYVWLVHVGVVVRRHIDAGIFIYI